MTKDLAAFPEFTPYEGPLPVTVDTYLSERPGRRLRIQHSPAAEDLDAMYTAFIYSEHGWPLASHRLSGPTLEKLIRTLQESPIQYVSPRVSDDGTHFC